MKKVRKIFTSILLVISMVMSTNVITFANDYLSYDDVKSYINNSDREESIIIVGKPVTYYFGDTFTVVEEEEGYSLITLGSNKSALYVNGKPIKVTEKETIATNTYGEGETDWVKLKHNEYNYDVGGLLVSIATGIVATNVVGITLGAISGSLTTFVVGGQMPASFVVTHDKITYARVIDSSIGKMTYWHIQTLYGGSNGDLYEHQIKHWEVFQDRLS